MVISDPATGGTQNRNVPAGAGVMAVYTSTDANRGIFKAPAGTAANFAPSTFVNSAYSLTNTDFDTVNNSNTAINVIRRLPGIGFCVMGARTLSTGFDDRYVPVRRTLGYLRKNLTDVTAQFVFEPNSSIIWSQISATIESFLYSFWRQGGLFGRTPTDAYYVKCDATTNNAAAQAAGELRVEVGVALQRPAEFVIIKLGQYQGGTSVTTSV
jgi:phage tail sheath protein FI